MQAGAVGQHCSAHRAERRAAQAGFRREACGNSNNRCPRGTGQLPKLTQAQPSEERLAAAAA